MTLCENCQRADRELWPIFGDGLCCRARDVAGTPRVLMAAAFAARTTGLDEAQTEWVRQRAYALIEAQRGRVAA